MIRAIWFDIGETLINENRVYGEWADWLKVPRHTFSAVFGALVERGGNCHDIFRYFDPDFDLDQARRCRRESGAGNDLNESDLYPDVRSCLQGFRQAGYFIGIYGNQPGYAGRALREMDLPCDVIATSDEWGFSKPDSAAFDKMIVMSGYGSGENSYVGDRLDNDIVPAANSGMFTVWLRRGPWGYVDRPDRAMPGYHLPAGHPSLVVRTLTELLSALTVT